MDNPFQAPGSPLAHAAQPDRPPPRIALALALGGLHWLAFVLPAVWADVNLARVGMIGVASMLATFVFAFALPVCLVAMARGAPWSRAAGGLAMALATMHLVFGRARLALAWFGVAWAYVPVTLAMLALQGVIAYLIFSRAADAWFAAPSSD